MIIKNESIDKKSGKKIVEFTTDREGWKVVMSKGQPIEVKMSHDERANRNHGAGTSARGAEDSKSKQSLLSKNNASALRAKREKMEDS